ncbi:MAG: glycosyltransferase, partial [Burkholderiaceae bacterium]|nr:glycosyltransferase [Burkholderiaceae bacterium]
RTIASYGFLLPHKGIQTLIGAFAHLAKNDPDLHLLLLNALYPVADSAQEQHACETLIERLGLGEQVTFITDFQTDEQTLAQLQTASLIVYPYQNTKESASGAVRIGLASGRPVAVTPLPIFEDVSEAVHTLSGTDEASLAAGIRQLLDSPAVIGQQASKTARWVAAREWPQLSIRLLNIIDGLANPLG